MKLIAQVKLNPTKAQSKLLRQTLERANAACNAISEMAWKNETFKQFSLHKLVYADIRQRFELSAQVVVRAIAKVSDAYKLDTKTVRKFKPLAAFPFDDRILTWRTEKQFVTIWTVNGRERIPYQCGERQKRMLESRQGESDLVCHKDMFFLLAVCEVLEPTAKQVEDAIGVDFGIANLATDSDGKTYTGAEIESRRQWYQNRRSILQSVGTRSSKRRLKKLSGKQRRYQRDVNHRISKELVSKAKDTNRAIAIEELNGIRQRTTVKKAQRAKHSNWTFRQLRDFLEYKSAIAGVKVIAVDARNTSRICSACGHCEKANRKSQSEFVCKVCHLSLNADYNAALNIRYQAVVNQPMVSRELRVPQAQAVALEGAVVDSSSLLLMEYGLSMHGAMHGCPPSASGLSATPVPRFAARQLMVKTGLRASAEPRSGIGRRRLPPRREEMSRRPDATPRPIKAVAVCGIHHCYPESLGLLYPRATSGSRIAVVRERPDSRDDHKRPL